MAKSTTIGPYSYKKQKDAIEAIRSVLNGARSDAPLEGDHLKLALALFQMHPQSDEKAPEGVVGITVRDFKWRGIRQRCFFAMRPDGTSIDWSYRVALRLEPSVPTLKVAGRRAIADTVAAYRQMRFQNRSVILCDVTGEQVSYYDTHVDHAPPWPFSEIVRAFAAEFGDVPLIEVDPYGDADFKNPDDRARFLAFHDVRAALRVVHWRTNLSLGAHHKVGH